MNVDTQPSMPGATATELLSNLLKFPGRFEQFRSKLKPEYFGEYAFLFDTFERVYEREKSLDARSVVLELLPEQHIAFQNVRIASISDTRTEYLFDQVIKQYARREILINLEKFRTKAIQDDPSEVFRFQF